ncbi:hypothetical protein [Actinoplanes siamensis]|uniref:Uncharacterized protein n=1 Tax=Actinoplanes siamensis TaxID=1223317 RepID=A0A919N3J4_9ACTN|nr:hypothetical protein [Actinoplanes siamensis]GIF03733.1 hypothetical protein Asi03nite_12710 [Actinoplanes siamensis]
MKHRLTVALAVVRFLANQVTERGGVRQLAGGLSSQAWWDVPVAEVATLHSTRHARAGYLESKRDQRHHPRPGGRRDGPHRALDGRAVHR